MVDLAGWVSVLDEVVRSIGYRFTRSEPRARAGLYVRGLLAGLERKNGWTLAEHAGAVSPDGTQRLLRTADWDVDGVRDDVRGYVLDHLADPATGVFVIDETGFVKKGVRSAGVQRQYTGTTGKIDNCQLGVFLAYASATGRALIDRELYLPVSWTEDRDRCTRADVPADVGFKTKPQLGTTMLDRAHVAGVLTAASWVTADEGCCRRQTGPAERVGDRAVGGSIRGMWTGGPASSGSVSMSCHWPPWGERLRRLVGEAVREVGGVVAAGGRRRCRAHRCAGAAPARPAWPSCSGHRVAAGRSLPTSAAFVGAAGVVRTSPRPLSVVTGPRRGRDLDRRSADAPAGRDNVSPSPGTTPERRRDPMTEGLVPRIAEDGRPQAMASRCPSCILNPGGSSRVAPDVVREVIRSHRDADAVVTCHETYPGEPGAVIGPSACRGHLDRYPETLGARIAAWIGGWHLVDLPDISETRARQG